MHEHETLPVIEIKTVKNGYIITICRPSARGFLPPFIEELISGKRKKSEEPGEEWKKDVESQLKDAGIKGNMGNKKEEPYQVLIATTWNEVIAIINDNKI